MWDSHQHITLLKAHSKFIIDSVTTKHIALHFPSVSLIMILESLLHSIFRASKKGFGKFSGYNSMTARVRDVYEITTEMWPCFFFLCISQSLEMTCNGMFDKAIQSRVQWRKDDLSYRHFSCKELTSCPYKEHVHPHLIFLGK